MNQPRQTDKMVNSGGGVYKTTGDKTLMEEKGPLNFLSILGKLNALVYRLPVVGEALVRKQSRAVGALAFYMPLLGGKSCSNIGEVKEEWLKFLGRAGISVTITRESENEFEFEVEACPWGFRKAVDQGVCDACMDLDRTYVKLLGGEMKVLESIPSGSACCRELIRMA